MIVVQALIDAVPQLRHVGSFNPTKLDPSCKAWMMRAERVFIDKFGGDFEEFFGAIISEYKQAIELGTNPEERVKDWIRQEIVLIKKSERQAKLNATKRH